MKRFTRLLICLLTAVLLVLSAASCTARPASLLALNRDGVSVTLSVNQYRLLLSRLKGNFVRAGYTDALQDSFWELLDTYGGESSGLQSRDDYYKSVVLEQAKQLLVGLWLYEKNGLSLSDAARSEIREKLDDLVADFGAGSKTRLNAVLSPFGVNYNLLKQTYENEKKVEAVRVDLYGANASKIGTIRKDQYLNDHYLRFRQIFIATYEYVYETDANGDTVYYDPDTGKIAYDTVNGYRRDGETDSYGNDIYYLTRDSGRIAYDTNGEKSHVYGTDGSAVVREMTEAELAAAEKRANDIFRTASAAADEEFEELSLEVNGETVYSDGYYLLKGTDYSAVSGDLADLSAIAAKLEAMEIGDTAILLSDMGYHVIRKYVLPSGAYENEVNADWFSGFSDGLISELFDELCRSYLDSVTVDGKVLEGVAPIREMEANYYF